MHFLEEMEKQEMVILLEDACKMMEDQGADVVGLNCFRGPKMTMKLLKKLEKKFHVM